MDSKTPNSKRRGRARLVRVAVVASVSIITVLILAVGVIGYAHTKSGRVSALGRYVMRTLAAACPVVGMSAETAESIRQSGLARLRGQTTAAQRPLSAELEKSGISLDKSTPADVERYMKQSGYQCEKSKVGFEVITCERVSALPKTQSLFTFGASGVLVHLEIYTTELSKLQATSEMDSEAGRLRKILGEPQAESSSDERLISLNDNFGGSFVRYRFANYLVDVESIRLDDKISLRTRYASAISPSRQARN